MYCSKCGTLNGDNAMFCKNCGASLLVQAQKQAEEEFVKQEEIKAEEPIVAQEEVNEEHRTTENPVIALIKKHSSSTLFLVATILFTVSLGLSLLLSMFSGVFSESGASLSFSTGYISVSSVLALVGLWKINTMNKKQGADKTGLVLLKVTCIIELITSVLVFSLFAFVFFALGVISLALPDVFVDSMEQAYEIFIQSGFELSPEMQMLFTPEVFSIFGIVTGVLLLLVGVITVLIYVKVLKTINTIKDMAEKGRIHKNVTNGMIVWMFILGGISASMLLTGDIVSASMGVAYILYAIVLVNFKNEAEKLQYVVNCNEL